MEIGISKSKNDYDKYYSVIDKDHNNLSIEMIMSLMVKLSTHYDIQDDIYSNDFLYYLENESIY